MNNMSTYDSLLELVKKGEAFAVSSLTLSLTSL